MKKPAGIKTILVLNYIKGAVISLILIIGLMTYYMPEESAFRRGFFGAMVGENGTVVPEVVATWLGMMMFPLILVIITIIFIYKKMYKSTIVMIVLEIGASVSKPVSLLIPIIMLLIVCIDKNSKNYLKRSL